MEKDVSRVQFIPLNPNDDDITHANVIKKGSTKLISEYHQSTFLVLEQMKRKRRNRNKKIKVAYKRKKLRFIFDPFFFLPCSSFTHFPILF